MFHDAVCGKDRSFEARYGVLQAEGSELEVVPISRMASTSGAEKTHGFETNLR